MMFLSLCPDALIASSIEGSTIPAAKLTDDAIQFPTDQQATNSDRIQRTEFEQPTEGRRESG